MVFQIGGGVKCAKQVSQMHCDTDFTRLMLQRGHIGSNFSFKLGMIVTVGDSSGRRQNNSALPPMKRSPDISTPALLMRIENSSQVKECGTGRRTV
jgi:hypothetical protein